MKTWPRKMWAACYRDAQFPGGWAPYSGHVYWYREDAVSAAYHLEAKVRAFSMKPWPSKKRR